MALAARPAPAAQAPAARGGGRGPLAWLRASSCRLTGEPSFLRYATGVAALLPLLALLGIVAILAAKAWPAMKLNGAGFLWRSVWAPGNAYGAPVKTDGVLHPVGARYGALPLVVGTLASSAIAVLFAVPLSVGAALAVVEKLPRRASHPVGMLLELLAGIPSVVFGLWGILTFGPALSRDVYPALASIVPNAPVLRFFRGDTGYGEGLMTAGLVLSVMIIPIVAATTRDLLRQVPALAKEGAAALGMNDWEVAKKVSIPWVRGGIIGASVLGLARALGETMAVAMVSGSLLGTLPANLYGKMGTIASTIVQQLDGAFSDGTGFAVRTLAEFALLLAVITLLTNIAARLLVRKVATIALPVGRGV